MGNCTCNNDETIPEINLSSNQRGIVSNNKTVRSQNKFFKLHKPNTFTEGKAPDLSSRNQLDNESLDERIQIQPHTKHKSIFNDNYNSITSNINININPNGDSCRSSLLPFSISSQTSSITIDKKDHLHIYSNNLNINLCKEEAVDPLSKAYSLNYYPSLPFQENKIDKGDAFSFQDSISLNRNFKDFEETASRETFSYLHCEIKKSSAVFALTMKKNQQETRFYFNKWKHKKEDDVKRNIFKSLSLMKFKKVITMFVYDNYYKEMLEGMKSHGEECKKMKMIKSSNNSLMETNLSGNGFINQMIMFQNISNKVDKMLLGKFYNKFFKGLVQVPLNGIDHKE